MSLYNQIVQTFEDHSNPELIPGMKAYMKNRFEFFGIKAPKRKEISKPFMEQIKHVSKAGLFELVNQLWNRPERELHYVALELMLKAKKHINEKKDVTFLQRMVLENSWWDTIDFIAPKLMKIYFEQFPEMRNQKVDEWIASENIWLQRCAILIHLQQKEKVDLDYMFATILRLNDTGEFFVNKAIGWVLREHARRQRQKIIAFVRTNEKDLSALSVKEALKHV